MRPIAERAMTMALPLLSAAGLAAQPVNFPNDPFFGCYQWGMDNTGQPGNNWDYGVPGMDIGALAFWERHPEPWHDLPPVIVGVVDTGVTEHVDFNGRVLAGWNEQQDGTGTDDGDCPHGTHVAGLIAAQGNNAVLMAGIDWTALVLPVRAFVGCDGTPQDCANGIVWAVDHGARIVNCSFAFYGDPPPDGPLGAAVDYAWRAGALCIAASGNQHGQTLGYPAAFGRCLAVGAINSRGEVPAWSNGGAGLDVVAPGEDIFSLEGTEGFAFGSGTSLACAHVSGIAAAMLALEPGLSPETLWRVLVCSASDLGEPGRDDRAGWGLVSLDRAESLVHRWARCPADCDLDGAVDLFDFLCFESAFVAGEPYADFDLSDRLDLFDFLAFVNAFGACP